ncbi:putative short-chain oxidoreductase [Delitschia confertaspora ATCC 74209]|uniref:Short-chain oxidoreductase n=1 Tax=Delitschia confertaspora ATCC 74209 TaxID=1513339 RepID=A0A9P4JN92_9PLEO|nr:putative short-chain oxidoreductase [Delitschia confertaspora ATCC 74209]
MATFTTPKKQLTWLITGSSSGFGLSLVRIAQAGGHRVIATSRNPSRTPELVSEVESKGGKWVQLDVDSPNSAQVIEELEKSGDEIDVLVNNAGFSIYGAVETFSEDELRAQMETMYFGPLRLIKAVLPHQRKRKFGVIVNFSSGASLDARDSMGAYAGAKAGLDGLTRVLAKEVAPFNIRALTVVLGTFNTNMGNASVFTKTPLPEDYKGSVADQMIQFLQSGKFTALINGDKDKAMKAVYEVVVGEGSGAGKEAERFLPLGSDMIPRIKGVQEYLSHGLEVFGDAYTSNVNIDK